MVLIELYVWKYDQLIAYFRNVWLQYFCTFLLEQISCIMMNYVSYEIFYIIVSNTYFWCGHCKPSWKTNFNSTQDSKSWFEFQMHKWKIRKDRVHQKSLTTILVPSSIIQPSFHRWKPPIFTYVVHTRISLCHSQHMCNYSRMWYSFE